MVILGLDLGSWTAWAVRDGRGGVSRRANVLDLRGDDAELPARMALFADWLEEVLPTVDAVAYEDVRFAKGEGGRIIGYQIGIVLAACGRRNLLCIGVAVPTLKQFATGNGNADKAAMVRAAIRLGVDLSEGNHAEDRADASWVAEWAAANIVPA